jgi:capsular exopolysaccharide synthesis family protein
VIPDANEDRAVDDVDLCRVVDTAPYSLLGESYRKCRTNLELSSDTPLKTLLVASGSPGDGRTSVACNLASAFVAKFEKVLLVDGNLRQPRLHLTYSQKASEDDDCRNRPGLTSILTGESDYHEAIPGGVEGLDLICGGPPTANTAVLLASRRMRELIDNVARDYDRVIIDSPPVLLVSDVKILAKLVHATVLVFNAAVTRRGAAERTISELQDIGANVVGCVLFGAEAMKGGYFRQQFKAYRRYLKAQMAASPA